MCKLVIVPQFFKAETHNLKYFKKYNTISALKTIRTVNGQIIKTCFSIEFLMLFRCTV